MIADFSSWVLCCALTCAEHGKMLTCSDHCKQTCEPGSRTPNQAKEAATLMHLDTMLTACSSSHLGQEEQIIQVCIVLQGLTAKHDHLAAHCSEALKLARHGHLACKTFQSYH